MVFLKVNETSGGGLQIINMTKAERITDAGSCQARIWFSQDDADTILIQESLKDVEDMMDLAINGFPRVVSKSDVEFNRVAR